MTHAYQILEDDENHEAHTQNLPLNVLVPSRNNPRKTYEPEKIEELATSLLAQGQIQNLQARPLDDGLYEVFVGNRRLAAFGLLAERGDIDPDHHVLVTVRDIDDETAFAIATTENIVRETMTVMDECDAILAMAKNASAAEMSRKFGLPHNKVIERLAVARLEQTARDLIDSGQRSLTWGFALSKAGPDTRTAILEEISSNPSAYQSAEQIRKHLSAGLVPIKHALFDPTSSGLDIQNTLFAASEALFADTDAFWQHQNNAIEELATRLENDGHTDVTILRGSPFPHWEYETSVTADGTKAVIVVNHDGSVSTHTNLVPISASTEKQTQDEADQTIEHNIFADDIADVHETTITTVPPNGQKAIACLAQARIEAAVTAIIQDKHLSTILLAATLIGDPRLFHAEKINEPLADLAQTKGNIYRDAIGEWQTIIEEAAAFPTPLEYVSRLSPHERERILRVGVALRLRNNIGRTLTLTRDSLPAAVLELSGTSIRKTWTPDEQFLRLLTTAELRALASDLLDENDVSSIETAPKSDIVALIGQRFDQARNNDASLSPEIILRLTSWQPEYL